MDKAEARDSYFLEDSFGNSLLYIAVLGVATIFFSGHALNTLRTVENSSKLRTVTFYVKRRKFQDLKLPFLYKEKHYGA